MYISPEELVEAPAIRPAEFSGYFDDFVTAVLRAEANAWSTKQALISKHKERALNDWFTEHAQMAATFRKKASRHKVPQDSVPDKIRLTTGCIGIVNKRDNYHCRYCGHVVLPGVFFKKFSQLIGEGSFRNLGTNHERHGVKLVYSATADHLVPRSDGGPTNLSNLVTSCWPCNYGKANFSIEELGIRNPLERAPLPLDDSVRKLLTAIGRLQDLPT